MENIYKIADVVFLIKYKYYYTSKVLEGYLDASSTCFQEEVSCTDSEIDFELQSSEIKVIDAVENIAILRKISNILLNKYNAVLFHASSIEYNGYAYLFTAVSGTGKSTHTSLLKELLGDKINYINDDKPIIRYIDGKLYVYGTPWTGKHLRGNNVKAQLKSIIKIERSSENFVENMTGLQALPFLFEQSLRPTDLSGGNKLFDFINLIISNCTFYKLYCNKELDSAKVSYNYILKGESDEN